MQLTARDRQRLAGVHPDLVRVIEIAAEVSARKQEIRGLRLTQRPKYLPHFTARFAPM